MKNVKTNREWFNTLPDNLRDCALEAGESNLSELSSSLSAAIYEGFNWEESLQGYDFWEEVYDAAVTINEKNEEASAFSTSLELSDKIIQHLRCILPHPNINGDLKKEIAFIIKDYVIR